MEGDERGRKRRERKGKKKKRERERKENRWLPSMRKEARARDQSFREQRLRQFLLYLPPEGIRLLPGLVPRFEIDTVALWREW